MIATARLQTSATTRQIAQVHAGPRSLKPRLHSSSIVTSQARTALVSVRQHGHRRCDIHASASAAESSAAPSTPELISQLTDELRVLETERDDAVKTAESCARTSVRLEEMVQLLDRLAVEKIKDGDEDGAREVLKEKASTKEILEKSNQRAQVNYSLASKLADKIGLVQRRLMDLLGPSGRASTPSAPSPTQQQQQQQQQQQPTSPSPTPSSSSYSGPGGSFSSSSYSSASGSSSAPAASSSSNYLSGYTSGYTPRKPAWEASLEEARARIKAAEEQAAAEGRMAQWQARESVEEARERLRQQAVASVQEAQQRVRAKASESIAEARARIAAEDAAVLAKVQALMARYRRGDYVSEDELEWAFRQLERRFIV